MAGKFSKLHASKLGIAGGLVSAIAILFIILFANNFPSCATLIKEAYSIAGGGLTGTPAFLSLIYAFIDGFVITWLFAVIYNRLL